MCRSPANPPAIYKVGIDESSCDSRDDSPTLCSVRCTRKDHIKKQSCNDLWTKHMMSRWNSAKYFARMMEYNWLGFANPEDSLWCDSTWMHTTILFLGSILLARLEYTLAVLISHTTFWCALSILHGRTIWKKPHGNPLDPTHEPGGWFIFSLFTVNLLAKYYQQLDKRQSILYTQNLSSSFPQKREHFRPRIPNYCT